MKRSLAISLFALCCIAGSYAQSNQLKQLADQSRQILALYESINQLDEQIQALRTNGLPADGVKIGDDNSGAKTGSGNPDDKNDNGNGNSTPSGGNSGGSKISESGNSVAPGNSDDQKKKHQEDEGNINDQKGKGRRK